MTQPKRGLGRGLDALFGGSAAPTAEPETEPAAPEVVEEPAPAPPPPAPQDSAPQ
jgi:hypothetical protein